MIATPGIRKLAGSIDGAALISVATIAQTNRAILPLKFQFWTLRTGEIICERDTGQVVYRKKVNYIGPDIRIYVVYETPVDVVICLPEER